MFDAIHRACLAVTEPILGWMLHLPHDVALLIISLGTALVLTLVRIKTTDQGLLQRCKSDKKRQKQLLRAAAKQGDRSARRRHRATLQQIQLKAAREEGWPLLASIVPIALIAVWAFAHIPYYPPDCSQGITLRMFFPADAIAELVHMLPPEEGVRVNSGLIRRVEEDRAEDGLTVVAGRADWTLTAKKRNEPYRLRFRWKGGIIEHELRADGLGYTGPVTQYGPKKEEVFEYKLESYKYKPLGVLKDWDVRMPRWTIFGWTIMGPYAGQRLFTLDAWLIAYLLIVVPSAFAFRRLLRIH